MRIAQVAPLFEAVPPKLYGGTERVVSFLTEELVRLGHEVTLFASGDSETSARLVPHWPRAMRLDNSVRDWIAPHMHMMEMVRRRAPEFDVVHSHFDYFPLGLFSRCETPLITTLHGRLDLPELHPIYAAFDHMPLISISDAQRRPMPKAGWLATVYHGLPDDLLVPLPLERRYLAFLGRICPEKRVDHTIRIAERAGLQLKIAAKVDQADREYFEAEIRPLIDASPHVEMIGEINDSQKSAFLSGALALIFSIDWPEPFGLAMIEAMACGTPVIAFNRGSVPEIVEQGVTGFIVENVDEAVAALGQLGKLHSECIRAEFERRFTARRMAKDYVALYEELLPATVQPLLRAGT
ncbi:MAG TPA: glycosyltransferase family 4 protein [Ferrovibrio sp.]|uniref:glycosyltransferase family 4 protein n=1 Tax=Ferrovibrio sp. TaxID=1917215 RepID=UPI002ED00AC2